MLIQFKSSLKTSILILLFMTGSGYLYASGLNLCSSVQQPFHHFENNRFQMAERTDSISADTIQTEIAKVPDQKKESYLADSLIRQTITFQVNSDLSYLNITHFSKKESKEMFYQAWLKEMELKRISIQTDSLRKAYGRSTNGEKEEIAALILKNEALSMSLNEEIPNLYQLAREQEDQYWKTCSAEEKQKIQEKIKVFSDSLMHRQLEKEAAMMDKIQIDTILISQESSSGKEIKTETAAIVYKIQIGAYKGKVPDSANAMIRKLSVLRKVENYTDEKGVKIYTTGNLNTYQEAVTLKNQVKQEGVKNPMIIAFQQGKRINLDESGKIKNEL